MDSVGNEATSACFIFLCCIVPTEARLLRSFNGRLPFRGAPFLFWHVSKVCPNSLNWLFIIWTGLYCLQVSLWPMCWECRCCSEIRMDEEVAACITLHPGFEAMCLNPFVSSDSQPYRQQYGERAQENRIHYFCCIPLFIALTCCWKMFSLVLFRCERKNIKIYRFDQENLCTMFKTCFWFVQKLVYWLVYYSTPVIMLTDLVVNYSQ